MNKLIKDCKKKYKMLQSQISSLEDKIERSQNILEQKSQEKQLAKLEETFDLFVREEYARIVFENYVLKNPQIVDMYTGKVRHFADVYGANFEEMPNGFKEGLVGLIEGYGAYRFA